MNGTPQYVLLGSAVDADGPVRLAGVRQRPELEHDEIKGGTAHQPRRLGAGDQAVVAHIEDVAKQDGSLAGKRSATSPNSDLFLRLAEDRKVGESSPSRWCTPAPHASLVRTLYGAKADT